MKLHENKELFQDAVVATSQQLGIKEIYIEKDYWVTFALFNIFKNDIGKETVFKGGTALSKCFGMIQRFSEDIDLVVLRNESETGNQLKNKIKKISKCVSDVLREIDIDGITNKVGMNPFEVLALNPKRTLCEKMMSLVRFSQTQQPIADLRNKIRHTYDIHLMLKDENLKSFFQSDEFETMLLRVANDDITSFKNNNEWLANHPTTAIIFSDTADTWNKIKDAYTGSFSELVFGELSPEKDILKTLTTVADRLKPIEWDIEP